MRCFQFRGNQQGQHLYLNTTDQQDLIDIDKQEVDTTVVIKFKPPKKVIDQPIITFGLDTKNLHTIQCECFQGSYVNENQYLFELCYYMTKTMNYTFYFDAYYLQVMKKARIYALDAQNNNVYFVFGTNDYKLRRILGITEDKLYTTVNKSVMEQSNQTRQIQQRLVIEFDIKMQIQFIQQLNVVCDKVNNQKYIENQSQKNILLRTIYNFTDVPYIELADNNTISFNVEQLVNGLQIYFQDENYQNIDLEGEEYILELTVGPSYKLQQQRQQTQQVQESQQQQQQLIQFLNDKFQQLLTLQQKEVKIEQQLQEDKLINNDQSSQQSEDEKYKQFFENMVNQPYQNYEEIPLYQKSDFDQEPEQQVQEQYKEPDNKQPELEQFEIETVPIKESEQKYKLLQQYDKLNIEKNKQRNQLIYNYGTDLKKQIDQYINENKLTEDQKNKILKNYNMFTTLRSKVYKIKTEMNQIKKINDEDVE